MRSSEKILCSHLGRPQSPKVELLMQELIHDAISDLMESSFLYRSRRLDVSGILATADAKWTTASLKNEFERRPWVPWSQNRGFTSGERPFSDHIGGCDPLGTPPDAMRLTFVIPTVRTWCAGCERITVHDSIPHIWISPYHLNPEAIAEPPGMQNFLFNMMCHECKGPPTVFMVRREILKVRLCGRSHPFLPEPPTELPKAVRNIFRDAAGAACCGDVFGAVYHLRTLMEHHMKSELGIPISERVDGEDLCARYSQTLDPVVRDRSALKPLLDLCSSMLHSRDGSLEDYERALDRIRAHFGLKQALQKLGTSR